MTMSTEVEKTLKIVPFTSKSLWTIWSKQFLARAHVKGYKGILEGTLKIVSAKSTKKGDATEASLRKLNQDAYNDLLLSFSDLVNFNLVDKACTDNLPEGNARLAWENLLNKHEPSSAATKVSLKMELNQSKLVDVKKDPDEWITGLEIIQIKLGKLKVQVSDEDLIIHIINNLPDAYKAVCDSLENDMNDENRVFEISLESVKERLRAKYLKMLRKSGMKSDGSTKKNDASEDALYAGKAFKGMCNYCGKQGHKAAQCRDKKNNGSNATSNAGTKADNGKTKFKCDYCGNQGHLEAFCFKKKREQVKESANKAEETSDEEGEYCLITTTENQANNKIELESTTDSIFLHDDGYFPAEENLYASNVQHQENLWIGDSGASSHMTNSLRGVYNTTDININIRVGDCRIIKATQQGRFRGIVQHLDGTTLSVDFEVKYVPDLCTNLISITSAIKTGSSIANDGSTLILSKGKRR